MEGSNEKRDLVVGLIGAADQSDFMGAAKLLKEQLDYFIQTLERSPGTSPISPQDIRDNVGRLIDQNVERIGTCLKQFGDKSSEFKPQEGDGFACTVGEATGWLRIEFRVGETSFIYMVAPNA